MRAAGLLSMLLAGLVALASAEPADQLDAVAIELEAIVTDLESGQAQTAELKSRLEGLQLLSEDHLSTLHDQEAQLKAYQATVHSLEDHDRASLGLADNPAPRDQHRDHQPPPVEAPAPAPEPTAAADGESTKS